MSGTVVKIPSYYSPQVSSSIILTARSDLGLISIRNFEGILTQRISDRPDAQNGSSPYLKKEFSYFTSGSICLPFPSTALVMFIVARKDAIKIQPVDCTRCLPGQIWRGSVIERCK